MYLLDTDICSYILREKPEQVRRKFTALPAESLHVSVITAAELLYGVKRSTHIRTNEEIVTDFLSRLTLLAWTMEAATAYASLRAQLEKQGTPIGNMDMLIAAHALSLGAIIVTNNVKHFEKVQGLAIENWVE